MCVATKEIKDFIMDRFSRLDYSLQHACSYYPNYKYCDESYFESAVEGGGFELWSIAADIVGASSYNSGATKLVFFFDEFPEVVVKLPLLGDAVYDAESGEFLKIENKYLGAQYSSSTPGDYCSQEETLYLYAESCCVEQFFTETEYICTCGELDIYVSKRADCKDVWGLGVSEETSKKARAFKKEIEDADSYLLFDDMYLDFLVEAGYELSSIMDLLTFIRDYEVSDFHSDNWGFVDGKIRIIDYSGFSS